VRLEAIVAASFVPSPESIEVATMALDKPMDPYLHHALTQAVHMLVPHWKPVFEKGELVFDDDATHIAFVLSAFGSKELVPAICKLLDTLDLQTAMRGRLMVQLVKVGEPEDLSYALVRSREHPEVLEELAVVSRTRRIRPSGDLVGSLGQLLVSEHSAVRAGAVRLAGIWQVRQFAPLIHALATSREMPGEVRTAAIEAVSLFEGAASLDVLQNLAKDADASVRLSAVAAICRINTESGAGLVAELLVNCNDEQTVKQLLTPLLELQDGTKQLASALQNVKISSDVAKLASRVMNSAGRGDAELQAKLAQFIGTDQGMIPYSDDYIKEMIDEARRLGDAQSGRAVYLSNAATCSSCHRINGEGGIGGPDLSAVARGLSPELIVESTIWPQRQVKEGYMATRILTSDGRVVQGYRVVSSVAEVAIKDPASGQLTRFGPDDIEEISDAGSLMPDGLTRTITRQELRDLLKYLFNLKGQGSSSS
jgi:putative heme-binding domain-containing protein